MCQVCKVCGCALLGITAWLSAGSPPAAADEGMWTLDNLPLDAIETRYGFRPSPTWIEHVQKASVDFTGASGAFVSPDGLVLTNHHVAMGQLHKLSATGRDFVRDGFYAGSAAEELVCPDLELRVLVSMENVTAQVLRAIDPRASDRDRNAQRKAEVARLEKESLRKTKLRSRVVELYRGGEYWLYRSRTYTDVRLVMAPEEQSAFYGGEYDNFSYPRHSLDIAFFRVYEGGKPLHPERWLPLSEEGPGEGDVVFVPGHPGSSGRRLTIAQLEYHRDLYLPVRIGQQDRRVVALRTYADRGEEETRRSRDRIRGLANNLKRQRAFLELLETPAIMDEKVAAEMSWRDRIAKNPAAAAECGDAWDRVADAQRVMASRHREYYFRDVSGSRLAAQALDIVRYVVEVTRPNSERLAEYRDSRLESLRFKMFSPAPIYADVDSVALAVQLQDALETLGPGDEFVQAALGGRTPAEAAGAVLRDTRLGDPAIRKSLVDGGRTAVEASTDPLLLWMRSLDPPMRAIRTWYEDEVESVESLEGGRIARARFVLEGKAAYPDATGTLRLSFGKVCGYEQLTTLVPWKTTFLGLFDRTSSFEGQPPFDLPDRVTAARSRLDLDTPLDFVSTTDSIGGNSGSPVVSRDLRCVGVVFDGNVHAFRWTYGYEETQARCISVHSAGILAALRQVYGMETLADELVESGPAAGARAGS